MKDREFLMWIHARLEHVHGEDARVDYKRKLRAIIKATPESQMTPNVATGSNLNELRTIALEGTAV